MKHRIYLVSAICIALGVLGCAKSAMPEEDSHVGEHSAEAGHEAGHEDIVLTAEAIKTAGIVIAVAKQVPMQAEIKVPGVVASTAKGRALVTPPVDGKVTKLMVTSGDRVRRGQPLAVIESVDLAQAMSAITEAERSVQAAEAEVNRSESEMDLARAKFRSAESNLRRQQDLGKAGAFSQPSVQEAENKLNDAEGDLQSAKEDESVHKARLERAERLFQQELISRSDVEEARLSLTQDQVRRAKAQRALDLALSGLAREKKIAEKGLLTAREVKTAESEVRAAHLELEREKIGVRGAHAALAGARHALRSTRASYSAMKGNGNRPSGSSVTVVAPMDGIVAHLEVSNGQAVERTTELLEIDDLRTVWVTASVTEEQISRVQRGSPVQVRTASYPDRVFPGIVDILGTRLDPKTRSMPVQCVVQNVSGALKPDMFAEVRMSFGSSSPALTVPESAIVRDGDENLIYVAEAGGKFEKRTVELGRTQGKLVEILKGVERNENVVVKGGFILKSQAKKDELKGHED